MVDEKAVNNVDTSDERVDREWEAIKEEEHVNEPNPEDGIDNNNDENDRIDVVREKAAEQWSDFFGRVVYGFMGKFKPDWKISMPESLRIGKVWARVAAMRLPKVAINKISLSRDVAPEIDAIWVTIEILAPRIMDGKTRDGIEDFYADQNDAMREVNDIPGYTDAERGARVK